MSYWVQGIGNRTTNQPSEIEANTALRQAGTNAIPTLLRMLRAYDSPLKTKLLAFASKQHFITVRHPNPYFLNQEAFMDFQALGPAAAGAVPELIKILEQDVSLSSETFTIRSLAIIGPPARAAVPLLLRTATDTNVSDHSDALWALGLIHDDPHEVVPVLIRALDNPSDQDKLFAAISLGRFHDGVGPAVPALVRIIQSTKPTLATISRPSTFSTTPMFRFSPSQFELRREAEKDLQQIDPETYARVVTDSVPPDSAGLGFFNQTNGPF